MPVSIKQTHYISFDLCVPDLILRKDSGVRFTDNQTTIETFTDNLRARLKRIAGHISWRLISERGPQQHDSSSCGVMVMLAAEDCTRRDNTVICESDVLRARDRIGNSFIASCSSSSKSGSKPVGLIKRKAPVSKVAKQTKKRKTSSNKYHTKWERMSRKAKMKSMPRDGHCLAHCVASLSLHGVGNTVSEVRAVLIRWLNQWRDIYEPFLTENSKWNVTSEYKWDVQLA